ncbi:6-N-hydroxylaminopurine resistance protein [Yersinia intermedia]|uniref:6-hydroxyaminopurine reductase n=1 Tax=Yersinia intermedia TaxID=631 RepID=UPI0005ACE7A1|nr:6-hydroxyaminopurine reductase [Yersinia intermedia]AJJ20439.1 protein yiiM [Yersinia intermedia]MDA5512355.1 6-hydroxyaminopurine reductase [Yersinia intermedia]CNI41582.1 6-N-hydroxylaminopurine resistance protein [Yersinia intermedia]CQD74372.1 6-N-hydroxylaminopurine resistance protein [Yersinia intermedia]
MKYPQIYIGKIEPYNGSSPSAIGKRQVQGGIMLTALGLEGDEQAETRFHGGPDRALCHYPREHYSHWIERFPAQEDIFVAPAYGENISTLGMTEQNVYMGDIYRWGGAIIQVTQPRSPCYKLNFHFSIEEMSALMQQTGYCGWLYRVISTGIVSEGHALELLARTSDISVAEAITIAWHMPFDEEQYRRLLSVSGLSASWSKTMLTRLSQGKIEDFNRRLLGNT